MRKSFNLAVQALTVQYQGRTALNNIHVTIPPVKLLELSDQMVLESQHLLKGY